MNINDGILTLECECGDKIAKRRLRDARGQERTTEALFRHAVVKHTRDAHGGEEKPSFVRLLPPGAVRL